VQFAAIKYDDKVKISAASGKLRWNFFIAPALREAQASRAYVLLLFKNILVISVSPIISTSIADRSLRNLHGW